MERNLAPKMRRHHIFFTDAQWEALEKLATERVSASEHIRRAIDAYLKRKK